jgi:hypothetical protein
MSGENKKFTEFPDLNLWWFNQPYAAVNQASQN